MYKNINLFHLQNSIVNLFHVEAKTITLAAFYNFGLAKTAAKTRYLLRPRYDFQMVWTTFKVLVHHSCKLFSHHFELIYTDIFSKSRPTEIDAKMRFWNQNAQKNIKFSHICFVPCSVDENGLRNAIKCVWKFLYRDLERKFYNLLFLKSNKDYFKNWQVYICVR